MKKVEIYNVNVVTATEVIEHGVCTIENGKILYVGQERRRANERIDGLERRSADVRIDGQGKYLIPGFIDLHCHGGNGLEFMDATEDEYDQIAKFHLEHGTTSMLATTLAARAEETNSALKTFQRYQAKYDERSLLGVHLEDEFPFVLRISAAPELENGYEFGMLGQELGLVMSVAHTDADFEQIAMAKENGYTLMTHLYSGMKGVTRKNSFRIAGSVEAGLYFDDLFVEIIADGRHLPLDLLRFIYKCKGADKICLITDAIRAAGLKNGVQTVIGSKNNGLPVIVEDEVAKLLDRQSFAGSTATADRLYKTMAQAIGKDWVALSKMASTTPARVMGWTDRGEIAVGKRSDLLLVDDELNIEKIFIGDKIL